MRVRTGMLLGCSALVVGLSALALTACEEVTSDQVQGQGTFRDDFKSALSPEDQAKVLARIDDQVITLGDFERHLASQPPYARARYVSSPERQKEFLDNLIRFEVLAAEAQERGYHRHPEVVQAMKQTMVRKMMSGEVQEAIKLSDVTDEEMKAYYEEHKTEYHKPEEVRVSHILVKSKEEADQLLAKLSEEIGRDKQNYRKIFGDLAKQVSLDNESKEQGGDLRFFARNEEGGAQAKPLAEAAFAIPQVGNLGPVVQTDKGFHVILLTGKKNRYDRDFEQVKRQIQNRLFREKKRQATDGFVEKLRAAAKIERHDDLLAQIKPDASDLPAGGAGMPMDLQPGMPGPAGMMPDHPAAPGAEPPAAPAAPGATAPAMAPAAPPAAPVAPAPAPAAPAAPAPAR